VLCNERLQMISKKAVQFLKLGEKTGVEEVKITHLR